MLSGPELLQAKQETVAQAAIPAAFATEKDCGGAGAAKNVTTPATRLMLASNFSKIT